jgi:hypothetical protein
MINHNGYFKENNRYFIIGAYGFIVEISALKVAILELIKKDGLK